MPATSGTVLEVNQTGIANDLNGGGFDQSNAGSLGNDMTYGSTAAVVSGAASSSNATTVSATWATASMQGNALYVPGYGTGTIVAVSAGVGFTLNAAIGTFTSVTSYVGGPKATPGGVGAVLNSGTTSNKVYQSGSFSIANGTVNTSGNAVAMNWPGGNGSPNQWIGYGTTRGDGGLSTLTASAALANPIIKKSTVWGVFQNLAFDGGSYAGNDGLYDSSTVCTMMNVVAKNCPSYGIYLGGQAAASKILLLGCGTGLWAGSGNYAPLSYIIASSCTTGVVSDHGANRSIFSGCGIGLDLLGNNNLAWSCSFYNNSTNAISASANAAIVSNCAFVNNAATASRWTPNFLAANNAYYGNTGNIIVDNSPATLTAQPFFDPTATITDFNSALAAFALNNTAGGGALCRGAGTPQYLDIGAVQHQDSGGGGVPRIVVPRRMW